MVMKLKTKITFFLLFNLLLLISLYFIPVNSEKLNTICIFKRITGNNCWNCGMTRAFLSVLHLDFNIAYQYNSKVIIVFPLTIGIYLYSWYKYIFFKGGVKNERKS